LVNAITIDGRGDTIREAVQEMWARMQPLEQRGFHPISPVEILDRKRGDQIIETYQLSDPEFQAHLESDEISKPSGPEPIRPPHEPERKEHYLYAARIRLEG